MPCVIVNEYRGKSNKSLTAVRYCHHPFISRAAECETIYKQILTYSSHSGCENLSSIYFLFILVMLSSWHWMSLLSQYLIAYLYYSILLVFAIDTFLHSGTLRWADLSSRLQRAMTIPSEVGGRFGSASISLCALPCGRWCWTLMVRTKFYLAFILLQQCYKMALPIDRYNIVNVIQCLLFLKNWTVFDNAVVHVWKYSYVQDLQCFQS